MGSPKKLLNQLSGSGTFQAVFDPGNLAGTIAPDKPKKPKKPPQAQRTFLDPNQGAAVSEARRRASLRAKATGRSGFRIDLGGNGGDAGQTRSGLVIS